MTIQRYAETPVFIRGQVEGEGFRVQAENGCIEMQEEMQGSGVGRGTRMGQWRGPRDEGTACVGSSESQGR